MQILFSTSPIKFITSDSFAFSLLLSIIARSFTPRVLATERARSVAKTLGVKDLAIIDKRREKANESEVINLIGDVENKICIVPDDLIDTAGTLSNASHALKERGAKEIIAYITHPVLSGNAVENLNNSAIDKLVVSNSIDIGDKSKKCPKIDVFDISPILSQAITRLMTGESISELFS